MLRITTNNFVIAFFIISICSCNDSFENYETVQALPLKDTLKSDVFPSSIDLLNIRNVKNINDKYLVVSENKDHGIFNVFSLPNLDFLYSWGDQGKGPDEFSSLSFNSINVSNDQLILYEPTFAQLSYFVVTATGLIFEEKRPMSYIGQRNPLNFLKMLHDSLFIARIPAYEHKVNTKHEFMALSPGENQPLFTFGSYPDTELEPHIRNQKFSKNTVVKPDGSKILSFYRKYNILKIYNVKGTVLKKIKIDDPYISIKNDSEFIYRYEICASDKYIFALAANATEKELESTEPNSFRPSLEIWDWDGIPIARYILDQPVHRFSISTEHNNLYGFSVFNTNEIYKFHLSGILGYSRR